MVTGFIWLFPSAGHSSKFNIAISLLHTLHNQSNYGEAWHKAVCQRGWSQWALCSCWCWMAFMGAGVRDHRMLGFGRDLCGSSSPKMGCATGKAPSPPVGMVLCPFCCCTEHQRILVEAALSTFLWLVLVGLDENQITFVLFLSSGSRDIPVESKNHVNWKSRVQLQPLAKKQPKHRT